MPSVLWLLLAPVFAGFVYGMHRLCLWLESRGLLYYLHKRPESGAIGAFQAIEHVLLPQAQHVLRVKEQRQSAGEQDGQGDNNP